MPEMVLSEFPGGGLTAERCFLGTRVRPTFAELVGPEALEQEPPRIESWPTHNLEL